MSDSPIRINARLSGEDARRFKELEALEGSATNVIREAIREYHVKRVKPRRSAYEIMKASGFIGGAKGPADLATRHSEYYAASLSQRYEAEQAVARAALAAQAAKAVKAAKRPAPRKGGRTVR